MESQGEAKASGSSAEKAGEGTTTGGTMCVERQTIYDWEIPIPRLIGGPSGGLGIGLSHGVLAEVGAEGSGPLRLVSLGWAATAWDPSVPSLSLHHPLHSLSYTPDAAELLFWTGMRIRWLPTGDVTVCPAPGVTGPSWRLHPGHLYWIPEPSPPPPLVPLAHDITLDIFPPNPAAAANITPAARRLGEDAIVIPNAKEENMTMVVGPWKLRQELKRGEVRVEGGGGEGGLRLNPTTRELSLNSPSLRLYVSAAAASPHHHRLYLRALHHNRALRLESGRLSVNQAPSFFDVFGNLTL